MKPETVEIESAFVAGMNASENATCPHHPATQAAHWWTRGFAYTARLNRALTAERRSGRLLLCARQAALQGLADALREQEQFLIGLSLTVGSEPQSFDGWYQAIVKQKESLKVMIEQVRAALDAAKPFLEVK